ncbi:MAG: hypothetical protein M0R03_16135 [Novosphingobium sp.]|nr:hypothetical protein [Novosphingobium sp.]
MKLACEIPISILEDISPYTDYDFVIGSYCLTHPKYKEFYLKKARAKDRRMIVDNGAFEEGKAMDSSAYKDLVLELNPNTLVLPDVINDAKETIKRTNEFFDKYDMLDAYHLMGVLQGQSICDYMKCLEAYASNDSIDIIGIPYHVFYRPLFIEKNNIIKFCRENAFVIHILGLPNPWEVVELTKFGSIIESIDTSLPVVSGLARCNFNRGEFQRSRLDINLSNISTGAIALIQSNINYLKYLIHRNDEFLSPMSTPRRV